MKQQKPTTKTIRLKQLIGSMLAALLLLLPAAGCQTGENTGQMDSSAVSEEISVPTSTASEQPVSAASAETLSEGTTASEASSAMIAVSSSAVSSGSTRSKNPHLPSWQQDLPYDPLAGYSVRIRIWQEEATVKVGETTYLLTILTPVDQYMHYDIEYDDPSVVQVFPPEDTRERRIYFKGLKEGVCNVKITVTTDVMEGSGSDTLRIVVTK